MELRPVDARTLRHALEPPPARRLRRISAQLLALAAVVFAVVALGGVSGALVVPLLALGVVAWSAYWTGLDRGLEALHRTGAAQAWAQRQASAVDATGDAAAAPHPPPPPPV